MCYLIDAERVIHIVGTRELQAFINNKVLKSVPNRTIRNTKNVNSLKQKTMDRIFLDIEKLCPDAKSVPLDALLSPDTLAWATCISIFKSGAGLLYPKSFYYAENVLLQIELAKVTAFRMKNSGNPSWMYCFQQSGLPQSVLPDSFLEHWHQTANMAEVTDKDRILPPGIGHIVIRTWLFVLAALEISLLNSGLKRHSDRPFIHRTMPLLREGKIVTPVQIFFEDLMVCLHIKNFDQLAESVIQNREMDRDSLKRQIYRWASGKSLPSWGYMRTFRDRLTPGEDTLLVLYGVVRFLQYIFKLCKIQDPEDPAKSAEMITVFQEYPQWQSYHQGAYMEWARAGCPLTSRPYFDYSPK